MKKIIILSICLLLIFSIPTSVVSNSRDNVDSSVDFININNLDLITKPQEELILKNINNYDGFFTANQGQIGNDSIQFYIQGKGVWFLDDSVLFEIKEPIIENEVQQNPFDMLHPEIEPEMFKPRKSVVLKLNFDGSNNVVPKGYGLLPHRSNFFYGNVASEWCSNVPNYQGLVYENLYDKIDLRYYSNDNGLKYDFIVNPGGNINNIKIKIEGAQDLQVNKNGNLKISTSIGSIIDSGLYIYQKTSGIKNEIDGNVKIIDSKTYGFNIKEDYILDKQIIIDPLIYSTFEGGSDQDFGYEIEVDSTGNAYATGATYSNDFPFTPGANDTTFGGNSDIIVFKLNPDGSSLIYSTYIGGIGPEGGYGFDIDSSGNAIIVGISRSVDFPITDGAFNTSWEPDGEVIIVKLDPTGSTLLYSAFFGGNDKDFADAAVVDSNGNIYVTGRTESNDFPTTIGANDTSFNFNNDVFILKLNPAGNGINDLIYSTYVGGWEADSGSDIAIDDSNNVYVTGYTKSINFPNTTNAYDKNLTGLQDAFVLKLDPTGSTLLFSSFLGGNEIQFENGYGIVLDSNDNIFIVGLTESADFPIVGNAFDPSFNGDNDIFIVKMDPTGSSILNSTYLGGAGADFGVEIVLDQYNNLFVGGHTNSPGFPNTTNAFDNTFNGPSGWDDIIVFKMDSSCSKLLYSTFIGNVSDEEGKGIGIDPEGNAYVIGWAQNGDFPVTPGANDTTHNGMRDIVIFKLGINSFPSALDLKLTEPTVFRTSSIYLYTNGTDKEDIEKNLTPYFEYRDPNELVWKSTYFSVPQFQNQRWEVSFTPPKNATLGLYDFRVMYNDTGLIFSDFFYLNNSLLVLNNYPKIEDLKFSNSSAILGDSIALWLNSSDIEDREENITATFEYRDPSEFSWNTTYLSTSIFANERWECNFNVPLDAPYGYYDLRATVNDSDGNFSQWLYENDTLLVYNTKPKVIDIQISNESIYRTETAVLFLNSTDYETPEDLLNIEIQYKSDVESTWINLSGEYSNSEMRWRAELVTVKESVLGTYDFRVSFSDFESLSSGWIYHNDSLEVLNNLPTISDSLDDVDVGIGPTPFNLSWYENDIEDQDINLTWSVDESAVYDYLEYIRIIDLLNNTLEIMALSNVTGDVDIELTLTDKDGGSVTKSDVTVHVNSTISAATPKVTLLTPPDNGIVNTLTPTLKWELDYKGTDLISYKVILDENPDPRAEIRSDVLTTTYTLETELEDGKTYYWKVIPKGGICLSEPFSFTINLGFEPFYQVNLTSYKTYVALKQDDSTDFDLHVKNEGNAIDNIKIEYSSLGLQPYINIEKNTITLNPDESSIAKLSITIPADFTVDTYPITVTAISLSDELVSDEIAINVQVISKDLDPEYNVSLILSSSSIKINPGSSQDITLTINNEGNIGDEYTISFGSNDFATSDIQFTKTSIILGADENEQVTVTISVPENMQPGTYNIKLFVNSEFADDDIILTVEVQEKGDGGDDETDNTMLILGIVIIVIIVVLIILFLFVSKRKKREEEVPKELPLLEAEPSTLQVISRPPQELLGPDQAPKPPQVAASPVQPQLKVAAVPQPQPQIIPTVKAEQPQVIPTPSMVVPKLPAIGEDDEIEE